MLVWQKFQQLAGEATMPDSVISSCHSDKHGTSLFFCLKRILNVLQKQNDLIYSRVSKSSLFLWKQEVDYWFNTIAVQKFEDLLRDTEQRDGTVALWLLYRFRGFRNCNYQCPSPDFRNFELVQAGRKEAT